MKQYEYSLIIILPPIIVSILSPIAVCCIFCDMNLIGRWIIKNVFSNILKEEKGKDGTPRWFFKDIDLTSLQPISSQEKLRSRIRLVYSLLFAVVLSGTLLSFWQLLVLEVSSDCETEDPSKDCYEVKTRSWPKQDPVNCSSAAIQNGTTYVLCYKIVFNLGLATGANYGIFKLSMLALSLGPSVMLMMKNRCIRLKLIIISILPFILVLPPLVLMFTTLTVGFLSDKSVVIVQAVIIVVNSLIFLWGIPWDKLTELKAEQNNPNNTGLENPVAATNDN